MQLTLENVGKIERATVKIDGITVIAGENNSGKSTVGKTLFSVFNTFYKVDDMVSKERFKNIDHYLNRFYASKGIDYKSEIIRTSLLEIQEAVVDGFDLEKVKEIIEVSVNQYECQNYEVDDAFYNIGDADYKKLIDNLEKAYKVSNQKIINNLLNRKLRAEFNGQICNEYTLEQGYIELIVSGEKLKVSVLENEAIVQSDVKLHLNTEAIYFDDPYVLDNSRTATQLEMFTGRYYNTHRSHLQSKLFSTDLENDVISEIIVNERLHQVFSKINSVCNGEMVRTSLTSFGYKKAGSDATIDIRNISTGLKSLVILKTLLQKGCLEDNGTIILDEPEIHLHPEWQVLFAELIVLIQKEFNMHVLINTHSPYFLRALQVYAAKNEIADKCNYYLASNHNENAIIEDVSDNIEIIYAKLARPFQDLENSRYRYE